MVSSRHYIVETKDDGMKHHGMKNDGMKHYGMKNDGMEHYGMKATDYSIWSKGSLVDRGCGVLGCS